MKQDIPHQFYLSLLEFLMSSKQHIATVSSRIGLTSMQSMTLLLIRADTARPMNSFCKLYNCDASNVTGIIDGLEQKGLVSRQENAKDRRIKQIQLEPAGRTLQDEIVNELAAMNGFMFDALNKAEITQFIHIIEKLAAHNQAHN